MSERDAWIQELKAGDKVIVVYVYGPYSEPIQLGVMGTVERTTKTQVILKSGSRFRRDSGLCVRASGFCLVEATKDIMEAQRSHTQHLLMLAQVRKVDLATLSLSQLSRIFDIIVEER